MIPIGLYIHIPWCKNKCGYCNFISYKYFNNDFLYKKYILSLIKDLKNDFFFKNDNRFVNSIYIGGGTPSLLSIEMLFLLLNKIFYTFPCRKNLEITIESNVFIDDFKKIILYPKIGINRISLGVQSFDNKVLNFINRKYLIQDILHFIKIINLSGYRTYNIDLIYGLPFQDVDSVLNDLKYIIDLNVPHLSWYQLEVKKKSYYYDKLPRNLPSQFEIERMYFEGRELLIKNGYFSYELSSYVKDKSNICVHNVNYWMFGDYFGIGCSSYSKITLLKNYKVYRFIKNINISKYIYGYYLYKKELLILNDIIIEYFICRLRLLIPFNYFEFTLYTGLSDIHIRKLISLAINKNFLFFDKKKKNFLLTNYGILYFDKCLEIFVI